MGGGRPWSGRGREPHLGGRRAFEGKGGGKRGSRRCVSKTLPESSSSRAPQIREGWRRQSGLGAGAGAREPGAREALGEGPLGLKRLQRVEVVQKMEKGCGACHGGWQGPLREEGAPSLQGYR